MPKKCEIEIPLRKGFCRGGNATIPEKRYLFFVLGTIPTLYLAPYCIFERDFCIRCVRIILGIEIWVL